MRNPFYIALLLLAVVRWQPAVAATPVEEVDSLVVRVGNAAPLTENAGQWDPQVRYAAQMDDGALFVEDGRWTVAIHTPLSHPATAASKPLHYHAYKVTLDGAIATRAEGEGEMQGYSNYFRGSDPSRWRSEVRSYAAVRMREVYDNVDLEIYAAKNAVKYNFIVHPGADANAVALRYQGTDGMSVDRKGALHLKTSVREIVEMRPYVYQGSREIASRWRVEKQDGDYVVRIEVGDYDHSRDLVIDPTLIFSTYTGSTADNWGTTAAYDSYKNTYTAGLVFNTGYPVSTGAYDVDYNGGADIGIFKFDTSGGVRLWATYLGGSSFDMPHSMFVNQLDELLIFGTTGSTNFPTTTGAYQTSHAGGSVVDYEGSTTMQYANGSDIFVSRLNANGTQLQASTLVGGSGNDGMNYRQRYNNNPSIIMQGNDSLYYNYGDGARGEIICDDMGNVYVGSTTMSSDFPTTTNCLNQTSGGQQDGVVFKLDYNLRNMLWSTYLGGNSNDAVYSIDVDDAYNVVVCGGTSSRNFPVTDSALQYTYSGGAADGFVSKISADGRILMASTYYGARFYDQLYFVRTGRHNEVFVFGQTKAPGYSMIVNAGYSVYNAGMLLARFNPDLSGIIWSTVFGTSGRINLSPTAFAADICNRVYAAGWGRDFVGHNGIQWHTQGTTNMECTTDAYQDSTDGQDFYIISLDANANNLEYATFFGELHGTGGSTGGSDHVDGGTSRFDKLGTLYQSVCASCGNTNNHNHAFPTSADAWSDSNRSGNCNNALFRFNVSDGFPVAEFNIPPVGCAPYAVQFNNIGRGTSFFWDFGDGTYSTQRSPQHTFYTPGTYTVTLIAGMVGGCSDADTQSHTVLVLGNGHYSHTPQISCGTSGIQIGLVPAMGATYQWTGGTVSDPSVANPWVYNTGTYILHTTSVGCSQTDTFHVQNYVLVDSWQPTSNSCHDTADASAVFQLGADIHPDSVTISITPTAQHTAPQNTAGRWWFKADSLTPDQTYRLTVTGYGCSYEQDFSIPNRLQPVYTKQTSGALCNDSCNAWIKIRYQMIDRPEISPKDTLIENLCEGTHIVKLSVDGCPLIDTTAVTRNHTLDSLRAWADADHIYLGESVGLHAESATAGNTPVDYLWAPAGDLDRPYAQHPVATPADTLVCYTVTATSDGCSATADVCINCDEVICGAPMFIIPNAFTPNGDGVNDRLCFNTDELTEFSISIFNRWGEMVYHSTDAAECWDGTYRGHHCLAGVYTYTCHIRCHADKENDFKGDITLIR